MNRWEWLEGLKSEPVVAVAVKHVARLIADELVSWPPAIEATEKNFQSRFSEILTSGAARPSRSAYEEALKRCRWEIARDFDAIDFYERNHHRASACPAPRDRLASELIQHYILEAFFVLMEKTDYRVKRKDVARGLDFVERRIELTWDRN